MLVGLKILREGQQVVLPREDVVGGAYFAGAGFRSLFWIEFYARLFRGCIILHNPKV